MNPTFRRLLREARPYYGRLVAGSLLGVLAGIAPLTLAKVAGYLQDSVLVPHPRLGRAGAGDRADPRLADRRQRRVVRTGYLTAFSGQRMVATFRARMFDRIARMPLRDFDRWRPGELQARMSTDLALMTDAISISLPQFVQVTVTFIAALVYMLWLDWLLAVVLFVVAPVVAFVVGNFNALIVAGTRRAQERIADLSSNLTEVLANERVVKAFRREDFERDRFAAANERYFGAYMKVTQFNQTQAPVLAFIVMLALCAIIALTAREVAVGRLRPATAWEFWTATAC